MRHDLGWCRCFERRAAAARAKAEADAAGNGTATSVDEESEKDIDGSTVGGGNNRIRQTNSSSVDDDPSIQSGSSEGKLVNTSGLLQTPPRKPHPIILSARFMTLPAPLYRRLFDEKFRGCILRADKALVEGMDSLKTSNELPEWWDFTTKAKFHGFLASFRASVARDEQMRTAAKHARHLRRLKRAEARLKGRASTPRFHKNTDATAAASAADGGVVASSTSAVSDVQTDMIETEISADTPEEPFETSEEHHKEGHKDHAEVLAKLSAAIERAAEVAAASAAASENMDTAASKAASSKCVTCTEGEALDLPWFEAGGQGSGERLRDMAKDALGPTWSMEAGYASGTDQWELGLAERVGSGTVDEPEIDAAPVLGRDSESGTASQQVLDFEDYVEGWWEAFEEAAARGEEDDWALWSEEVDESDDDEYDEEDDDIGVCGEGVSCARFGLPRPGRSSREKSTVIRSSAEGNTIIGSKDGEQDESHEHVNEYSGHSELRNNGLAPVSGHSSWAPTTARETAGSTAETIGDTVASTAGLTYDGGDANSASAATHVATQTKTPAETTTAIGEPSTSLNVATTSDRDATSVTNDVEIASEKAASAVDVDNSAEHHPTKQVPWRHGLPHVAAHAPVPENGSEVDNTAAGHTVEDSAESNLSAVKSPHTSTTSKPLSGEDSPSAGVQEDYRTPQKTTANVVSETAEEEPVGPAGAGTRRSSGMSGTNEAVGVRRMRIGGSWFAQMRNETDADAAAASATASVAALALGVAVAEASADSDTSAPSSSSSIEPEASQGLKEGASEAAEDASGPSGTSSWWAGGSKAGGAAAHKDGTGVEDLTPPRGAATLESTVHTAEDGNDSDASAMPSLSGHGASKMPQLRSLRPHTATATTEAVASGNGQSGTASNHPASAPAAVETATKGTESASEGHSGIGLSWAAGMRRARSIHKPPSSVLQAAETPGSDAVGGVDAREIHNEKTGFNSDS